MNNIELALTYDDVQLVPQYSEVDSRRNVDLSTPLSTHFNLMAPYIASPMNTVCGYEMAITMMKKGGVGCIHRFMSLGQRASIVSRLNSIAYPEENTGSSLVREIKSVWGGNDIPIMVACGVGEEELGAAVSCIVAGANVVLIDVAHGHHKKVKEMVKMLRNYRETSGKYFDIIAGNVATGKAAGDLEDWGVDGIRVGIGGGALCTTRIETGHGVPNITSLIDVAHETTIPVIADGGIRTAGDVAKALAVGADTVMLGSLLAGTEEAPGEIVETPNGLYKKYRGSASLETKSSNSQERRNIEGVSTTIPFKGGASYIINRLNDGLQSACSYSGAQSLDVFKLKAELCRVTQAGQIEAKPHLTI